MAQLVSAKPWGFLGVAGGAPLIPAPFLFVNGPADGPTPGRYEGWSSTWAGAPPSPFVDLGTTVPWSVTRQGFTQAGGATTYVDTFYTQMGVRQPWPNQALSSADISANSDYPYVTDVVAGAGNNSTLVSPLPTCNAVSFDRRIVGDTIEIDYVAFHRNARRNLAIPCLIVTASDGVTTSPAAVVTSTIVAPDSLAGAAFLIWRATLDVSALANPALIAVNAVAYPWIGGAASVNNSALAAYGRGFGPRYFRRDTARAATPAVCYLDAAVGNDATGIFSTNPAAAAALPFLTVAGVQATFNDAIRGAPATGGILDGVEVRARAGTFNLGAAAPIVGAQQIAAMIFTRDPLVAKAAAVYSWGAATFRPRLGVGTLTAPLTTGAVEFRDCSLLRTGALFMQGEAATQLQIYFKDMSIDFAGFGGAYLSNSHDYMDGLDWTNLPAANSAFSAGTLEHRLMRRLNGDLNGGNLEAWLVVGSRISRPAVLTTGTRTASRRIVAFNRFTQLTVTNFDQLAATSDVEGAVRAQNLFEYTGAASAPQSRLSGDSNTGNLTNFINWNNTLAGYWNWGRENDFYDETAGVFRYHILQNKHGCYSPSTNCKNDVFSGVNFAEPGHIGDWGHYYGAGNRWNITGWADAADGAPPLSSFGVANGGQGSIISSNTSVNANPNPNPLFAAPACSVFPGAAGAGNGDYRPTAGSALRGVIAEPVLSHDLDGNARPATGDTVGCYV